MAVQKSRKEVLALSPAAAERYNHMRSFLKGKVPNRVESPKDLRKLMHAMLELEGGYIATDKGRVVKNETMRMLEGMSCDPDPNERATASISLGNMRLNFPELSGWTDEILLLLGTDRDERVRRSTVLALNLKKSAAQHCLGLLKEKGSGAVNP